MSTNYDIQLMGLHFMSSALALAADKVDFGELHHKQELYGHSFTDHKNVI